MATSTISIHEFMEIDSRVLNFKSNEEAKQGVIKSDAYLGILIQL